MASHSSRTNLRNPGFRRRQPQECATGSMKIAASSLPCFFTSASVNSSSLKGAINVFAACSGRGSCRDGDRLHLI